MMDKKKTSKKKTSDKVLSTRRGHGDKVSYMPNLTTNMTTSVYKTPKAGPSYRDVLSPYMNNMNTHTTRMDNEALRAHVLEKVRQFDGKMTKRAEWRQQLEQAGLIEQNDNRELSTIIMGLKETQNLASPTPAQQAPDFPTYPTLETDPGLAQKLQKAGIEYKVGLCRNIINQHPFTLDKNDVQRAVALFGSRVLNRPYTGMPTCLGYLLNNPNVPFDIKSALYTMLLQYLMYGCYRHLQGIAHVLHVWFGYSELLSDYNTITAYIQSDQDAGCKQSKVGGGKPLPTRQRRGARRSQAK